MRVATCISGLARQFYKDSTLSVFAARKSPEEIEGNEPIASALRLEEQSNVSAVSLLFAPGKRPRALDICAQAKSSGQFSISLDPSADGGQEEGWLELLANGMTFDLVGLAPQAVIEVPQTIHAFGLREKLDVGTLQPVLITPGPHLAAGSAMFPVVRTLAMIAAQLVELDGVDAVAWHPARAVSDAGYFRRSVLRWIEGGAFPGLGLSALVPTDDGGLASEGLALFTGQELFLTPDVVSDKAEGAKIALRLLNWLVENGRVTEVLEFTGPSGEALRIEPTDDPGRVKLRRLTR